MQFSEVITTAIELSNKSLEDVRAFLTDRARPVAEGLDAAIQTLREENEKLVSENKKIVSRIPESPDNPVWIDTTKD